jgi:hypothetical protein
MSSVDLDGGAWKICLVMPLVQRLAERSDNQVRPITVGSFPTTWRSEPLGPGDGAETASVGSPSCPLMGPLAARHLSAHDVSLDLHRGVGDRDEPRGVSVGVITRGVSARAGLGCQSEVDPGDHDSGR